MAVGEPFRISSPAFTGKRRTVSGVETIEYVLCYVLHNKEEDIMIKIKGLLVMSSIIVTFVTFFVGSALAERVARDNKGEGYVFIGGSVKEIIVS